jgi:small-conductance mechanosensitive channel
MKKKYQPLLDAYTATERQYAPLNSTCQKLRQELALTLARLAPEQHRMVAHAGAKVEKAAQEAAGNQDLGDGARGVIEAQLRKLKDTVAKAQEAGRQLSATREEIEQHLEKDLREYAARWNAKYEDALDRATKALLPFCKDEGEARSHAELCTKNQDIFRKLRQPDIMESLAGKAGILIHEAD